MRNHWIKPKLGNMYESNIDFSEYQGSGSCSHLPNLRELFTKRGSTYSPDGDVFTYELANRYKRKLRHKLRGEILLPLELARFLTEKCVLAYYKTRHYNSNFGKGWIFETYTNGSRARLCNWVIGTCNFYDLERKRQNVLPA